ncbi:hypothetical protein MNJPNG_22300 [Cupriavidus oxalaticus]|uniref:hypothetical protein n=1 Tax=Cupriavidus oxalaticus TaxID=96344 RepID=UPI003F73597A
MAHQHGPTTVRNLSFPGTARIEARHGSFWYACNGYTREVRRKTEILVRPFNRFELGLSRGTIVHVTLSCEPAPRPLSGPAADKPLTRELAQRVFATPHRQWSIAAMSLATGRRQASLSRELFAEGSSFRELLRTTRLNRLFVDIPGLGRFDHALAAQYGFRDRCQLEDAVFDHFGLTLMQLSGLHRHAGHI